MAMDQKSNLMRKGFKELQQMDNRKQHKSVWNPPNYSSRGSPSQASQAVKQFYNQQAEKQATDSLAPAYLPELDKLQKCFLTRPGCPKYSHRATSTSQLVTSFVKVPQLPSNVSTMSLSSQIPLDEWDAAFQNPDDLESRSSVRYYPVSISQSMPKLLNLDGSNETIWLPNEIRSRSGTQIPWYIAVLQEKDMLLQRMAGEVSRLSKCETECTRKDDVISILREEVQSMQKQLDDLAQGADIPKQEAVPEQEAIPVKEERPKMPAVRKVASLKLQRRGVSLPVFFSQQSISPELREEMERLKAELSRSDKMLDTKMVQLSHTLMKDQEELEELEKEGLNQDPSVPEAAREMLPTPYPVAWQEQFFHSLLGFEKEEGGGTEEEVWRTSVYMEMQQKSNLTLGEEPEMLQNYSSKEVVIGGLEVEEEHARLKSIYCMLSEFQKMNSELYEELEKVKEDYDIATGAISSLQRQLSFEASQLRKAHSEQDLLRKELRERGNQLEAMSTKFSDLREERKHEEMMGTIERENHRLRQDVSDLESKLSKKSQTIEDLQSNVNRLQAELLVNQHHVGKQLSQQSELQRQLDTLQRAEQQTRVTLEVVGARFERFRSKIIQATYSSPGTKSPQAEIGDEEVLDALQRIIMDRVDFHQMLKQKGVKVPPLNSSEPIAVPTNKKKSTGK